MPQPLLCGIAMCELNGIVARGKELFYEYLAQFTLNDLLKRQGQLRQIFSTRP